MTGLFSGLTARARFLARDAAVSAGLGLAGLIVGLAGLGCLTAALWIVIAAHQGAAAAFLFVGIIYLAVGIVFLVLAARPRRGLRWGAYRAPVYGQPAPPREPLVQLAEGFVIGMQAGRAARNRR